MTDHRNFSFPALFGIGLCSLFLFDVSAAAQTRDQTPGRIQGVVDEQRTVRLAGSRPALALPQFDAGPADPNLPLNRMILVLQPDAEQHNALASLVDALHDPTSPQYHQWLTPEEFARQFGASQDDVERVTEWLRSRGFTIEEVPAGNQSIVFGGSAAQVEAAFHTTMRRYRVNGNDRVANATDISIPAALAGVVAGPVSLHNFPRKALHRQLAPAPQYTSGGVHSLGPPDFATIYDLNALYNSGITGSGQVIGIVGRINIDVVDVQDFRSTWALPVNNPTVIVNGTDPGIYDMDEEAEADLDVEWSGSVAPMATVKFVVSASTNTTDGVDLSAQYIVSHNLASTMSTSFGSCEAAMGSAERAFYSNLWQQAAAEGITAFIAAGDSGAAGCDGGSETTAAYGAAVNGLCSSVSSVCVGGTEFNENGNNNLYWSATNASNLGSALSYIPEVAWNESGTVSGGSGLWATGGGASAYYSKPSWQTGPGVPADGQRDVPDISVDAAGSHDPFWVVILDNYYTIGGTSAASPSMAGIMALIDQKNGGRQGNANTKFYALAAAAASGGAAVFHGTTGGNNSVPGVAGFTATTHYNQATGLGSPDGFVMANHWTASSTTPTLSLTASVTSLTLIPGAHGTVTATVAGGGGFSSAVTLTVSGAPAGVTTSFAPSSIASPGSGTSVLTVTAASSAAVGSFTLTLTATGGSLTKTATVTIGIARPFTISASASTIKINQGSSGSFSVTTAGSTGFSGAIALTASAHTGVTAVFTPATISSPGSGNSALNLTVAANAAAATYTLTITGTSGSTVETTTVSVTIAAPPNFTLTLPVSTVSVAPGGSGTLQVNIAAGQGFNSAVTLSAGAVPQGLTISFSSNKMTVQAASTLAVGSYPVTITGTSGGVSAPPVTATISVGTFALSVPATATISRGHSLAVAIHTTVTNGYNVPVVLSGSGLSSSLNGSFSPSTISSPASGSSTLTLTAAASMGVGSFRINIVATSDGVTVIAPLTVKVQ